jgi:hypothetical protein
MQELEQQQQDQYGDAPLATPPGATPAVMTSSLAEATVNSSSTDAAAQTADEPASADQPAAAAADKCSQPQQVPEPQDLPDLDYDAEEMTSEERQLLRNCLQLLEASALVLKEFSRVLLQVTASLVTDIHLMHE